MEGFGNVYKGKTVLVTGHTGFKGSWLSIWLNELGAQVIGYSLDPYSERDNFVLTHLSEKMIDIRGDIRDKQKLVDVFEAYKPEYVFHLAAQPLVRLSYEMPVETYETNVMGTINVLECIKQTASTKVGIFITTDKCYLNKEQVWGYREEDALGGYDPYSSSKAAAELVIDSWRQSFMNPKDSNIHHKAIASVRAGNVIGGGDWAKNRIIPDCIKALERNSAIEVRNPYAMRPWQHVLEPLSGYLLLGEKLTQSPSLYATSWNFGPLVDSVIPVKELVAELVNYYGKGKVNQEKTDERLHEATLLNLDISKSYFILGWKPSWSVKEALFYTSQWYKNYLHEDVYQLCKDQINQFISKNSIKGEDVKNDNN